MFPGIIPVPISGNSTCSVQWGEKGEYIECWIMTVHEVLKCNRRGEEKGVINCLGCSGVSSGVHVLRTPEKIQVQAGVLQGRLLAPYALQSRGWGVIAAN